MEIRRGNVDLGDVEDQLVGGFVDLRVAAAESKEGCLGAEGAEVGTTVAHSVVGQLQEELILETWVPAFGVDGEDAVPVLRGRRGGGEGEGRGEEEMRTL